MKKLYFVLLLLVAYLAPQAGYRSKYGEEYTAVRAFR